MTFSAPGQPALERDGTVWGGGIARFWSGEYEAGAFVSFAAHLLQHVLLEHLGETWSQFEPKAWPNFEDEDTAPNYTEADSERLREIATRFLSSFGLEQERISFAIVAQAARLVGTFAVESATARLREIKADLPPPSPPKRSYEEVKAERDRLPLFVQTEDAAGKKLEDRIAALETEMDFAFNYPEPDGSDYLLNSITQAQRQIEAANDVKALVVWATAHKADYQWALRRLAQLDAARYAEAIESLNAPGKKWLGAGVLRRAGQVAPERAVAIARRLPPTKRDPLAISAFLLLRRNGAVPDEAKRLAVVTAIMRDPKADSEERRCAFEVLVPTDEPFRYPGREVDETLLGFVNAKNAAKGYESFFHEACRALGRRKRTDLFERMAEAAKPGDERGHLQDALGALTQLAQFDPARLLHLTAIIKPELFQTNATMSDILWDIWAADLRELEPELERLATTDPEEYEDGKAHSSGGKVSSVTGRFHLARQVVTLWREPDALTRARMLTALALAGFGVAEESTPSDGSASKSRRNELPPVYRLTRSRSWRPS